MKKILAFTIFSLLTTFSFAETLFDSFYEIAKEKSQTISDIRAEMDRINDEILQLLTERTAYVKRADDIKLHTSKIADDRQRVADQEKKVIDRSIEFGLPVEISIPAFKAIMENSVSAKLHQSTDIELSFCKMDRAVRSPDSQAASMVPIASSKMDVCSPAK